MPAATVGTPFDDGLVDNVSENMVCSIDSTHIGQLWREDDFVVGRFQFWLDVLALAADGLSLTRAARAVLVDGPTSWAEHDGGNGGGYPQLLATDFGALALVQVDEGSMIADGAFAQLSLVGNTGTIAATLTLSLGPFDYWVMFPVNGTCVGLLHADDTNTHFDVHTLRIASGSLTLDPTTPTTIAGGNVTQGPINGGGCFLGPWHGSNIADQCYVATDPGSGPLTLTSVSTVEAHAAGNSANWGCIGPNAGQGAFFSIESGPSLSAWVVVGHQSGSTWVTDSKTLVTDRLRFDFLNAASSGPLLVNRGGQIDIGSIPIGGFFGSSPGRVILDLFGDATVIDIVGSDFGSAQFLAAPAPNRLVATMGWQGLVYPIQIAGGIAAMPAPGASVDISGQLAPQFYPYGPTAFTSAGRNRPR